jgi:hypothetical protein
MVLREPATWLGQLPAHGLAKEMDGRLATFDRRIPLSAAIGADQKQLEIIPA